MDEKCKSSGNSSFPSSFSLSFSSFAFFLAAAGVSFLEAVDDAVERREEEAGRRVLVLEVGSSNNLELGIDGSDERKSIVGGGLRVVLAGVEVDWDVESAMCYPET